MTVLDTWTAALLPWVWGYFFIAMGLRLRRILRLPYRKERAPARGSARYGALYALSFAMLPWKKESTRTHWATYLAGMLLHVGVFAVLAFALARWVGVGAEVLAWIVRTVGTVGLAMAVALLIKRAIVSHMRAISSVDDFLSNALVDLYLLGGVLTAFDPAWLPVWRLAAIVLLIWIPLGKIFHMVLFFVSRVLFGWQFGRRGVINHAKPISY